MAVLGSRKKDKGLGVAEKRRAYDIALQNDPGRRFLILLMALMVALAVMSVAGFFALQGLAQGWIAGLENKVTLEVPALAEDGTLRDAQTLEKIGAQIAERLDKDNNVRTVDVMDRQDVAALLSPWLEGASSETDLPLPVLIGLELRHSQPADLEALKASLGSLGRSIRIDDHSEWLGDILVIARLIQFAALTVAGLIGVITFAAIASAIHARIQVHKEEVELLHLIGARDDYIVRQFQRYITALSMRGCLAGFAGGMGFVVVANWLASRSLAGVAASPGLPQQAWIFLALIPLITALIAVVTARVTVMAALERMP